MEKLLRYTGKDLQELTMDEWLQNKPEELIPIALKWFAEIKSCGEDVQDIFHDGYPMGCVESAPFAYVNAFSAHVNIGFFYGVDLEDDLGLLEGNGRRMRHIKIRPGEGHDDQYITVLVQKAYQDIKRRLRQF